MKYRKKPIVVDAWRFNGDIFYDWPEWLRNNGFRIRSFGDHLHIDTEEGTMRCDIGDWIICGVKGELYPIKPDIFELTYDSAEPESQAPKG